jgi:hypothetical protein
VARRERRVVTPDGYVWFVRRRRARRRPLWSRRYPERFCGEDELPEDEPVPLPGPIDLFTDDGTHLGDRFYDDQLTVGITILVLVPLVLGFALLVAVVGQFVVPWLVPLVTANAHPLLAAAGALALLVALNQVHRPWYVELRRQGLADAPRRVWRVQGWRRSGRLMDELTAAIREGRIDNRRAVILLTEGRR